MRLDIPRSKLGFQMPNVPYTIDRMMDCRPDFAVVMQDTAREYLPYALERNPNLFVNLRWYTFHTIEDEHPHKLAGDVVGWVDGLIADCGLVPGRFSVQLSNEQNIGQEHPDKSRDYGTLEYYKRIGGWEYEAISHLKSQRPDWLACALNLAPGHSEDQPDSGFIAYELPEIRRAVDVADILGMHCYWRDAGKGAKGLDDAEAPWYFQRFRKAHEFFPGKPLLITEANGDSIAVLPESGQRMEAALELRDAIRIVEKCPYVLGCCFFIWFGFGHPVMACDETETVLKSVQFVRAPYAWPLSDTGPIIPPLPETPPVGPPDASESTSWRLAAARLLTPEENHWQHHIFFETGKPFSAVKVWWGEGGPEEQTLITTDTEGTANFPMYGGPYWAQMAEGGDIASGLTTLIEGPDVYVDGKLAQSYKHYSWLVEFSKEAAPVTYTREEVIAIIKEEADRAGVNIPLALAMAEMESNLNPLAAGDLEAGVYRSIGLYQLHERGLGAGMTRAAREDPRLNAAKALPSIAANVAAYGEEAAISIHNQGLQGWLDHPDLNRRSYVEPVLALKLRWAGVLDAEHPAPLPADWNGPDWWQSKSERQRWLAHARLIDTLGSISAQAAEAIA